jgi:uncharacterized protein with von Willebrand factor type A (vWA) domain
MQDVLGVNCKALQRVPLSRPEEAGGPGTGYLLGHLLRFGQLLRLMGVDVSTSQVLDLVEALGYVSILDRSGFYHTARALLVNRREDFFVFDQAFYLFWRLEGERGSGGGPSADQDTVRLRLPAKPEVQGVAGQQQGAEAAGLLTRGAGEEDEGEPLPQYLVTYSPAEILRHKDFGEMTWEEIQEAKRAIASLKWRLGQRRTRRIRPGSRGRMNLRRMVRDNLRHGGEPVHLAFRQRVYRPRSLVILCDVSGSMERYSRMLLHFVHALTHGLMDSNVEAFVFGTRLTRITRHLRYRDVDESLDEVGEVVGDWSGGTRIGEALRTFNFQWIRRVLGRGAVVLVISDGWDRGDQDLLAKEMWRLQRSAYRLIWLNPLMGLDEYKPVQRGMRTAMTYVDDFLPVHNLASLEQLAENLSTVAVERPLRKQHPRPPACEPEEVEETAGLDQRVAEWYPFLKPYLGLGRSN